MGNRATSAVLALLLATAPVAHAGTGTDGAAFLNIPVGAGPAALGSAYTALANDAYAPVLNPAGLGFLESTQVAAQHLAYLESIHYEYASIARPLWKSTACGMYDQCGGSSWGAAFQYLGSGDITGRNDAGDLNGNFSSHYLAGTAGYGKAITPHISIGAAGKLIQGKLADVGATAYAADLGLMAKLTNRWTLAAVVANLGSSLKFLDQPDPLPLAGHLGAAYQGRGLTVSAEGVLPKTGANSVRGGVEWRPMPMVALRAGYRTDTLKGLSALAGFSTGVGIDLWGQEFAYAWVPYGELGNTQYVSMVLRWGEMERRRRNLIFFHSIHGQKVVKELQPGSDDFEQLVELLTYTDNRLAEVPTAPVVRERLFPDQENAVTMPLGKDPMIPMGFGNRR